MRARGAHITGVEMSKSQIVKIVAMIVAVAALVCVFAACSNGTDPALIKEYQVEEAEFAVGDTFTPASVTIRALLTDDSVKTLKTDLIVFPTNYKETLKLVSEEEDGSEVWKFTVAGTYKLEVNYLGDKIEVEIVVK